MVNFYEKCDEVWAVSASSSDTLRGYGYSGDIRVMPNGTDAREVSDETVREGENGYLCHDDPADLARVIDEALSDPDALRRVRRRARDTIPIPWDTLVDDVLARYSALIA